MLTQKNRNIVFNHLLFFFIWPLMSLFYSLKRIDLKWTKNIFWLFCIYFGYTFVVSNKEIDAYRYIETFKTLSDNSYSFNEFISFLFSGETKYVDIVNPLISFILSRFTSDGRILLATYGMFFGFFYSRNIWYLLEKAINKSIPTIFFIIVFSLIDPIWKLGTFRFGSAIHVFLYGALPFLLDGNTKKIWACLFSPFVHFTFIFPLILLMLYFVVGNRQHLFILLFAISLFINDLNLAAIQNQFQIFPEIYQQKASSYITEDYYQLQTGQINITNWYIKYYIPILKFISAIFIFVIYIFNKTIFNTGFYLRGLWCFTILFYAFANLVNLISQGIRFYAVANLLTFFLLSMILSLKDLPGLLKFLKIIVIPFLILLIIVDIRRGSDFIGLATIFGNPLIAPFFDNDISLISIVKSLF